jgi:DnaK suppressor protein
MTPLRFEELQQMFDARRRALQRALTTKLRDARANTIDARESGGLDAAETSDADLQQDVSLALIAMSGETLRRIDDAVERFVSGAYGRCSECGGEISQKRLEALPFAVRCRDCEETHEVARRSRYLAQRRIESLCWTGVPARD